MCVVFQVSKPRGSRNWVERIWAVPVQTLKTRGWANQCPRGSQTVVALGPTF